MILQGYKVLTQLQESHPQCGAETQAVVTRKMWSLLLPGKSRAAGQQYTHRLYAEIYLEQVQKGLTWVLLGGWWAVSLSSNPPVARDCFCCLL